MMLAPGIDLYVSEVLGPSSVASTTRKTGHLVEGPTGTAAARLSQRQLTANGRLPQWLPERTHEAQIPADRRKRALNRGKLAHPEVHVS